MPSPASRSCSGFAPHPLAGWGVRGAPRQEKGLESPSADKEKGDTWSEGVWGEFCHGLPGFHSSVGGFTHTQKVSIDTAVLENLRISDIQTLQDLKDLSCISPLSNTQCVIELGEPWWCHHCKLTKRLRQESFEEICLPTPFPTLHSRCRMLTRRRRVAVV